MLAADLVHPRDQLGEAVRLRRSSRTRIWYFSESRYSSLPGLHRHVLGQLEAAVDAVARAERRRQHQPHLERRASAVLQVLVQDVGRIGEQIRTHVLAHVGLRQLGEVLGQLRAACFAR